MIEPHATVRFRRSFSRRRYMGCGPGWRAAGHPIPRGVNSLRAELAEG
jgi:hypothetical protein